MKLTSYQKAYSIITVVWIVPFLLSVFLWIELAELLLGFYFLISIIYMAFVRFTHAEDMVLEFAEEAEA
jgi:hypothetical protein